MVKGTMTTRIVSATNLTATKEPVLSTNAHSEKANNVLVLF